MEQTVKLNSVPVSVSEKTTFLTFANDLDLKESYFLFLPQFLPV